MKYSAFFAAFLFFFVAHVSCADEKTNEYGSFTVTDTGGDYTVAFVLDSANKKFKKFQEVMMTDYGNDGEGDVSVLLYRNGNKEVYLRKEESYRRYTLEEKPGDVCDGGWSPKILYRENLHAWECSKINFFMKFLMWREIDDGFADAKAESWSALAARIMKNVERFVK